MMNDTIKGMGFHHAALNCKDFDKSIAFYLSLGCKVKVAWGEGASRAAMLDLGDGGCIELFAGGIDAKTESKTQSGEWFHLALSSDDPDAAYAAAIEAGAKEKTAPFDTVIGSQPPKPIRIAFVYGPDGEVIEFFHVRDGR